jgi:hypothetical protein
MQTADTAPSLMGDAQLLAELGRVETRPKDALSEFPEMTAPVVAKVTAKPIGRASRRAPDARNQGPQFMMPGEPNLAPPIVAAAKPSAMQPAVAVVGFVLMMLVGAGAAVLVFHDRVEQIVVQWQPAGR